MKYKKIYILLWRDGTNKKQEKHLQLVAKTFLKNNPKKPYEILKSSYFIVERYEYLCYQLQMFLLLFISTFCFQLPSIFSLIRHCASKDKEKCHIKH